jgi:ADP-ribosyl-[dinitrogen reductase] hydrolase
MLLEMAVGDAYGAGFECVSAGMVREHNRGLYYIQHPRHKIQPGRYTDDTQMSLAVAEALLSGEPWTRDNLARRFVEGFHRDPREGYASRFHAFLARVQHDSDRSGAAMRAPPLGVLSSARQVVVHCRLQAALTHDTPDGIHAAIAAALMTHYFLYDLGPTQDLGVYLEAQVPGEWSVPYRGEVGLQGWMSVRAAITAVVRQRRLSDLLRDCVAFTGDVDTVASIALAAASCSREYVLDLPPTLLAGLENGPYGRDYLMEVDRRLLALVGKE